VTAALLALMATVAVAEDQTSLPKLTLFSNVNVFDGKTDKGLENVDYIQTTR